MLDLFVVGLVQGEHSLKGMRREYSTGKLSCEHQLWH